MIKKLRVEVDFNDAVFEIDTEKVTEEFANEFLNFFMWSYNKKANPIEEMCRKIAIKCWKEEYYHDWNLNGLIEEMKEFEGYPWLDGTDGIKLLRSCAELIDEDNIEVR